MNQSEYILFSKKFLRNFFQKFKSSDQKESPAFAHHVASSIFESMNNSKFNEECPICLENPTFETAVLTPCMHMFCRDCLVPVLKDKIRKKTDQQKNEVNRKTRAKKICKGECPVCDKLVAIKDLVGFEKSTSKKSGCIQLKTDDDDVSKRSRNNETKLVMNDIEIDESVAREALESALQGSTSAKLEAVIAELDEVWKADPGCKIVIFSQFLGFLDVLDIALPPLGVATYRLDGSMNMTERFSVLKKFTGKKTTFRQKSHDEIDRGTVLLMSMKAGGVGLNLVAASTVFLVDPWWNAAFEDQCIHRVHRIGQTSDLVRVRKFIVEDSVEEKIVSLQERKKEMVKDILRTAEEDDGTLEGEGGEKPTLSDFAELFGRS